MIIRITTNKRTHIHSFAGEFPFDDVVFNFAIITGLENLFAFLFMEFRDFMEDRSEGAIYILGVSMYVKSWQLPMMTAIQLFH